MKKIFAPMVMLIVMCSTSCNNKSHHAYTNKDSSNAIVVDCMPLVKPIIPDSTGIVKTPPTNDSIAITQDSLRRHR